MKIHHDIVTMHMVISQEWVREAASGVVRVFGSHLRLRRHFLRGNRVRHRFRTFLRLPLDEATDAEKFPLT